MEPDKVVVSVKMKSNVDEQIEKAERLRALLKEASSLINELAQGVDLLGVDALTLNIDS